VREIHGELILSTTGLADGSIINAGVLFKLDGNEEDVWDGVDISWTYNHAEIAFPEWTIADLNVRGKPDVFNDGVESGILSRDSKAQSDWIMMGSKSKIDCYETGSCSFKAHFYRDFNTNDS